MERDKARYDGGNDYIGRNQNDYFNSNIFFWEEEWAKFT